MMSGKWGDWTEEGIGGWDPKDVEAHMDFMRRVGQELQESGELVAAEGLAPPDQAKIVNATADGTPAVTDGPFAESKEFLAGYWIVDVESPERAIEIAAQNSAAPGPGGTPMNMAIEVRGVMQAPAMDVDA
jgi:hypothetical protein